MEGVIQELTSQLEALRGVASQNEELKACTPLTLKALTPPLIALICPWRAGSA